MNKRKKPFLISLWVEIITAIFLWWSDGLWLDTEVIFSKHIIERIFIFLFPPIIWLLRENNENNAKYLKYILIIIEIYLLLVVFVQEWSNFSKWEFLILYLSIIWLTREMLIKRYKRWQTIFLTTIYWSISIIIILIWCLMWYRTPIDYDEIYSHNNYFLYTSFENNIKKTYSTITLKYLNKQENISLNEWFYNYPLNKNTEYTISFVSQTKDKNNLIIIQDPKWNILVIPPQTEVNFWTTETNIKYTDYTNNSSYYWINEEFPEELKFIKTNYNNSIKSIVLNNLPSILQNNIKYQKLSIIFTKALSSIFPFRYRENEIILNEYIKYFSNDEIVWALPTISNPYESIKDNTSIGVEKLNNRSNYKKYINNYYNKNID